MQPTVGRSVHYQRGGQTLHAVITRVEVKEGAPSAVLDPAQPAGTTGIEAVRAWLAQENNHDVWLAVFLHTSTIGTVEFSPIEIPLCAGPLDKTWSWPPRVP